MAALDRLAETQRQAEIQRQQNEQAARAFMGLVVGALGAARPAILRTKYARERFNDVACFCDGDPALPRVVLCTGRRPDGPDAGKALQGGAQQSRGDHLNVEACWDAWKAREKLDDGKNERNGYYILVSHQKSAVIEEPGSKNWLAGRNQAFNYAEIAARAALRPGLRSTIQSSRQAAVRMFGGDDAPRITSARLSTSFPSRTSPGC